MDYKYKCKNHGFGVYKCMDWVENHDACKNCELRSIETVVFTIRHSEVEDRYFIRSDSKEIVSNALCDTELFSAMKEFKDLGEREGFKVVFEVN